MTVLPVEIHILHVSTLVHSNILYAAGEVRYSVLQHPLHSTRSVRLSVSSILVGLRKELRQYVSLAPLRSNEVKGMKPTVQSIEE